MSTQRDWAGVIAPWIAIISVGVAVVFRFAALEEAKNGAVVAIGAANNEIDRLKSKIESLEGDRTLQARLEEQIKTLQKSSEKIERRVEVIDEKVSKIRR